MKKLQKNTVTILIIVTVMLALLCITKYNTIATLDEAIDKSWAPLESALQQRYDGVPKLVNEVILYTSTESETSKALAAADKEFDSANGRENKAKAANNVEINLTKEFIEATQRYPGIASHYQFTALQKNFEMSGKDMVGAMGAYNNAVGNYNTYVRKFPNDLVALLIGFNYKEIYFKKGVN
jgi:LemA protein